MPSRHVAPCNSAGQPEGDGLLLSGWGLPADMVAAYERRGLCRMFPWQRECLLTVLHSGRSLVYSAPTSAGKSLVAELLMLKRVLETHTKALMVLPFISLAREKLNALQGPWWLTRYTWWGTPAGATCSS